MTSPGPSLWHAARVATTIIYADERIVAIDKPAGVSLATRRSEPTAAVARLLAEVPAEDCLALGLAAADLLLVHRLDVGTSGIVLLARDAETHRALSGAFAGRRVTKHYLALVWGAPRPRVGRLASPLGPDRRDRRRMRVALDGRPAATFYRVVARAPHAALLLLEPKTGRTHQVRVHLAHAGHPIVGDDLYGGPRHRGVHDPKLRTVLTPTHTFLHAWRLHLPTTRATAEIVLTAPLPGDFREALAALGIPWADVQRATEAVVGAASQGELECRPWRTRR
jgi:23S rRNA pseudouridine1911/1915/1917 synthase